VHVWPIVGHDQNPIRTTTSGQAPFGPAACGIAWPSGVCAAAITCWVVSPLLEPPEEPAVPVVGGGGGGGCLCRRKSAELSFVSPPAVPSSVPSIEPQLTLASTSTPSKLPTIPLNPKHFMVYPSSSAHVLLHLQVRNAVGKRKGG
jgi:hypothetical protein